MKLFGFKIYSNPNKISGLDGKDEILFKVPYFNKLYGLPTSLVIAVDINGEEFNKMFVTYGIEYKSLDKPAYIVEEFTYLNKRTKLIPKVTFPSPSLWANFWLFPNLWPT